MRSFHSILVSVGALLTSRLTAHANTLEEHHVPLPSDNQLRALDVGLAMFIHFSVNPWSSIEHNCVGNSSNCIPASKFNPTNLSTDAWVEAAVAFGAKEICLTAHHEGGFCLWDTKYSDYSVMHSPYGKDIVKQFVASCKKYNVKPCYYMGPNANGYLSNKLKLSAEEFVEAQLGMLTELLEDFEMQPSRLWWDHYGKGCNDGHFPLNPCPEGSFPKAWSRFVDLVREKSPNTIICPGPDCDGHQGESGIGTYPSWNQCDLSPDGLHCNHHKGATHADFKSFHPYEACATMQSGWFCQADGSNSKIWGADKIWDHYMQSVGEGWINTLNAPVCTTGQMYPGLVKEMTIFGNALRSLFSSVLAAKENVVGDECNNSTVVELSIPKGSMFNAVILREDLSKGQRVVQYALDYFSHDEWVGFTGDNVHGQSVGNLLIDLVEPPPSSATAVRLRCLKAMETPVYFKSVSLNTGARPPSPGQQEVSSLIA